MISDEDSKIRPSILARDPYSRTLIDKHEYIGHVQKRVGYKGFAKKCIIECCASRGKMINKLQNLNEAAMAEMSMWQDKNASKVLNKSIQTKYLKTTHVETEILETKVCPEVCCALDFHDNACDTLNVFRNVNIGPGYFTPMFCNKEDCQQTVIMNTK